MSMCRLCLETWLTVGTWGPWNDYCDMSLLHNSSEPCSPLDIASGMGKPYDEDLVRLVAWRLSAGRLRLRSNAVNLN